jgi:hypothetical protein
LPGRGALAGITPAVAMLHVGDAFRDEARAAKMRGDAKEAAAWQIRLETLAFHLKEVPGQSEIGQNVARQLYQLARR